jgi:hypothetical protein
MLSTVTTVNLTSTMLLEPVPGAYTAAISNRNHKSGNQYQAWDAPLSRQWEHIKMFQHTSNCTQPYTTVSVTGCLLVVKRGQRRWDHDPKKRKAQVTWYPCRIWMASSPE